MEKIKRDIVFSFLGSLILILAITSGCSDDRGKAQAQLEENIQRSNTRTEVEYKVRALCFALFPPRPPRDVDNSAFESCKKERKAENEKLVKEWLKSGKESDPRLSQKFCTASFWLPENDPRQDECLHTLLLLDGR